MHNASGCYPLAAASMAFGGQEPTGVQATGTQFTVISSFALNSFGNAGKLFRTGADLSAGVSLSFGDKGIANILYTVEVCSLSMSDVLKS